MEKQLAQIGSQIMALLPPRRPTPLVPIRLGGITVYCKLEMYRESGSHKCIAAEFEVARLRLAGKIGRTKMTRFIISSSGNYALGLAYHMRGDNVELIVVTDVLSPGAFEKALSRYKHVTPIVEDDPDMTGSHIAARKRRIAREKEADPDLIELDQYANPFIPLAYETHLVPEVVEQARDGIGAVYVAVGTCGLVNGFCRYRRKHSLDFPIHAVDADGSCLARPPRHGAKRRNSGYGNGNTTGLLAGVRDEIDYWEYVRDGQALAMCHRLLRDEGMFVGPSSGAVLAAIEQLAASHPEYLPEGGAIIAVLSDSGRPYRDTAYSQEWINRNGFVGLHAPALPAASIELPTVGEAALAPILAGT
jgi:N-(2-amino-2-carboxyethyl)-L-glutamate synthase